jgi:hypothetical protein
MPTWEVVFDVKVEVYHIFKIRLLLRNNCEKIFVIL